MNSPALKGIDLHDIISAPAPDFWPPAPGWWLLVILISGLLIFLSRKLVIYLRRRHLRARIFAELNTLDTEQSVVVASSISRLLRRVALMCYPRNEVASLNGNAWLVFLDKTGGGGDFLNGIGKVLATAPYSSSTQLSGSDNTALIELTRKWLSQNLGQYK